MLLDIFLPDFVVPMIFLLIHTQRYLSQVVFNCTRNFVHTISFFLHLPSALYVSGNLSWGGAKEGWVEITGIRQDETYFQVTC